MSGFIARAVQWPPAQLRVCNFRFVSMLTILVLGAGCALALRPGVMTH